jgi:hypothetical protein
MHLARSNRKGGRVVEAAASSSGVRFCRCKFSTVAMRSVSSLDRSSRMSTATVKSSGSSPRSCNGFSASKRLAPLTIW